MANFTPEELEEILQQFFDVTGKRQYIGARYIPIFGRKGEGTIEWDNSAPYESLTIVMHNGVSYVSKKYVPADIEITDTTFWAETYRFNAQVEQYRQEVLRFDGRINANANGIDKLKNIIPANEFDSTHTIKDDITSVKNIIPASDFDSEHTVKDYIDNENTSQSTTLKGILIPFPDSNTYPKFGSLGQVLTTLADGKTKWENPVVPSDEQAEEVISAWLAAHPEATTTVNDNSLETAKLTRWAFCRLSPLRIITTNAAPYIAFTTSDQKMTIPRDTIIAGPQYYYVFAEETVIDLGTIGSTAKVVGFNPQTNEIIVAPYNYFTVGRITQVLCAVRSGGTHLHIDASFPYTVDGMAYGVEIIPNNDSLETTKLTRWAFSRLSPLRIITTNASPYIAFTTRDQKMTIPRDSVIVGPQYYYVFAQETVIDLSSVSSTAKVVGFNPQTNEIIVAPYNNFTVGRITQVLCAVRSGGTHLHIDASFPYTVDGMAYGVEPYTLNMRDVKSFLPENIKSVDHRGYSSVAPENTIPAFLLSRKNGFSYVETDVQFTSDNIPVLLHDDTINRTARNADGTEILSTINIRDITYTQALTYDFGIWKNSRYAGTKIPTLDEFMQVCKNLSIHPYIEIKSSLPTGQETQLLTTVINIVKKYDMIDNSTFISFNGSYLSEIASIESNARLGLLSNQLTQQQIDTMEQIHTTHGNEVFVDVSITDTNASNLCMNNDMTLEMWTLSQYTIADFPPYASGATTADFIMSEYYYNHYNLANAQ